MKNDKKCSNDVRKEIQIDGKEWEAKGRGQRYFQVKME